MYKFKVLFHPDTTFWFIIYSLKVIPRNNTEENSRNISYKSAESNLLNDSERDNVCVWEREKEIFFYFYWAFNIQTSDCEVWNSTSYHLNGHPSVFSCLSIN